jgi:hypothetical protein
MSSDGAKFGEEGRRESVSPQANCCPVLNAILLTRVTLYLFYRQFYHIEFVTGNIKILVHALHDELQIKGIENYLKCVLVPAMHIIITDID